VTSRAGSDCRKCGSRLGRRERQDPDVAEGVVQSWTDESVKRSSAGPRGISVMRRCETPYIALLIARTRLASGQAHCSWQTKQCLNKERGGNGHQDVCSTGPLRITHQGPDESMLARASISGRACTASLRVR
jgi:hypothetical protein